MALIVLFFPEYSSRSASAAQHYGHFIIIMNTILYATDFSENARNALTFAYEISKLTGAGLTVIHIHDIPTILNSSSNAPSFPDIENDITESEKKRLQDFCQFPVNERIKYEIRENSSTIFGITEAIEEFNAGLVVIGTKGKSKLRELLMGSTAMGLIKKAACPVLSIPDKAQYSGFKKILYATDLDNVEIEVISDLCSIAEIFESELVITHISPDDNLLERKKMQQFQNAVKNKINYSRLIFVLISSQNIIDKLNDYIKGKGNDLVAIYKDENKNLIDKLFHRDTVKRIEFHSEIPLLSYNDNYLRKVADKRRKKSEKN